VAISKYLIFFEWDCFASLAMTPEGVFQHPAGKKMASFGGWMEKLEGGELNASNLGPAYGKIRLYLRIEGRRK
jgi:hypothetical protein